MSGLNYLYILFTVLFLDQREPWITYYENDNFIISYRLQRCNDIKNGFDFSYYFIKATNKTEKTIVVDFVLRDPISPSQREENKVIVILEKKESKEGSCNGYNNLQLFYSDNMSQKKSILKEFKLSSINFVQIK
tara:strand:+ start:48 stop:449 length:402 start_codon:yes stop_codon:yes gene_type:complete